MVNDYNEISYAKKMLECGFLTNRRLYELCILSKYFFNLGCKKSEVKENIIEFCHDNLQDFNEVKYFDKINQIVNTASRNKPIEIGAIPIYKSYIDFIEEYGSDLKTKKVLMSLIVFSDINKKLDKPNYLNMKYSLFIKTCGIQKVQNIYPILAQLEKNGLIRVCRNSNIEMLFNIEQDEEIFSVSDFNSIYMYYYNYIKRGKYIECSECGKIVKYTANRKYCKECQHDKYLEKQVKYNKTRK